MEYSLSFKSVHRKLKTVFVNHEAMYLYEIIFEKENPQ